MYTYRLPCGCVVREYKSGLRGPCQDECPEAILLLVSLGLVLDMRPQNMRALTCAQAALHAHYDPPQPL
jgi:hypothetical protein